MKRKLLLISMLTLGIACMLTGQEKPDPGVYGYHAGALIRGDTTWKTLALVFTGDEFADGGTYIRKVLNKHRIKASFFLTGKFYINPKFHTLIDGLVEDGHYLGAHSDQHLLYCDWENRDSLLLSRSEFQTDLDNNYKAMSVFGIHQKDAPYFLPPYEWYNDTIASWTRSLGLCLINYTPGTLSHADYTLPGTPEYRSSRDIYKSILDYEKLQTVGLNGFILLSHVGTSPERMDKFYLHLEELIGELKDRGYDFVRIDHLLPPPPL